MTHLTVQVNRPQSIVGAPCLPRKPWGRPLLVGATCCPSHQHGQRGCENSANPNGISFCNAPRHATSRRQVGPDSDRCGRRVPASSVERLQREVIEGLATSGAFDPYRYALTSDRIEPDTEVEAPARDTHTQQ